MLAHAQTYIHVKYGLVYVRVYVQTMTMVPEHTIHIADIKCFSLIPDGWYLSPPKKNLNELQPQMISMASCDTAVRYSRLLYVLGWTQAQCKHNGACEHTLISSEPKSIYVPRMTAGLFHICLSDSYVGVNCPMTTWREIGICVRINSGNSNPESYVGAV